MASPKCRIAGRKDPVGRFGVAQFLRILWGYHEVGLQPPFGSHRNAAA
jgi:hypothetical protein